MLNNSQIRDLKKMLDDRFFDLREEIRLELLDTDDQTYIELAGRVHDTAEASVADLLVDLLVDLQLADIDRHIQETRDIDAALMRIAAGNYGVCNNCKTSIAIERLHAYPTAKRCHRCVTSALTTLASTAKPSPLTSPALIHRSRTCSNTKRNASASRKRPWRFFEKVE